jgi:hypothetical protein
VRRFGLGLPATLAALIIAACDSNGSSDDEGANPPTIDIQLGANVESPDGVTVDIEVFFYWPYFEYLRLGEGNTLTACAGTACTPLTRNFAEYEASLPYVAETAYTISLSRRDDVSAPNTFVTLPVPFTILAPAAGSQVTDGQTITLQWSPPGINTRTSASGFAECEHPSGETTSRVISLLRAGDPDSGTVSFSMAQIMSPRPWPTPRDPNVERCDVELTVRMGRTGVADSAFRAGSHIYSSIERSVTIEYMP